MLNRCHAKNLSAAVFTALLVAYLGGCSHLLRPSKKAEVEDAAAGPTQTLKISTREKDALRKLELQLENVKSPRVIFSTAALRALVKNQRSLEGRCENTTGQLDALKNIDLEETGGGPR